MSATMRKARVAVVGCGGWTQGWHLPNLAHRSDAEVVAVVDPTEQPGVGGCVPSICAPMPEVAAKYSARWYKSIEEVLADNDELKLDGVLCAAPHQVHAKVGTAVLEAGLHLLMEKPMTADTTEARMLLDLARSRPTQAFLLNNTANWQPGTVAAYEAVAAGKLGAIRHVNAVFAAPLEWLFGGDTWWAKPQGSMVGNGFGWGQLSHTFAWIFKVTNLTPKAVFAVTQASEKTGADLYDAITITCTNGATISVAGVGACPDKGFKVLGNWIFGTEGMMSYSGLAGSDNVKISAEQVVAEGGKRATPHLELWRNDGTHELGPPVEFEHLDQVAAPGSMDAWLKACLGQEYFVGAGPLEGLKSVATIEAMYRSAQSGQMEQVRGCEGLEASVAQGVVIN